MTTNSVNSEEDECEGCGDDADLGLLGDDGVSNYCQSCFQELHDDKRLMSSEREALLALLVMLSVPVAYVGTYLFTGWSHGFATLPFVLIGIVTFLSWAVTSGVLPRAQ
jgi:hypothetical protein